jgi:hypothetical protein
MIPLSLLYFEISRLTQMTPTNELNKPEHELTEAKTPRKPYESPKARVLATQTTKGGGNPAYIEDGFGKYES